MNTETIFVMEPLLVNGETITYSAPYPPGKNTAHEASITGIVEILCAITVRNSFERNPSNELGQTQQSLFDDFLHHLQDEYFKDLKTVNSVCRDVAGYLERFPDKRIQAYVDYEQLMLAAPIAGIRRAKTGKQKHSEKRAKQMAAKSKKKNRK